MDAAGLKYWTRGQQPCPHCGGTGVPMVLDIVDEETQEAVRTGLACLGDCCFDGARGVDRECLRCGHQWNSAEAGQRFLASP